LGDVIQNPDPPALNPDSSPRSVVRRNVIQPKGFYFLWSLERVAMAYGLDTIGGHDWYTWGSQLLIANQGQDGSWQGQYPEGGADTAFSLLFLKHANLAGDLTNLLRGRTRDPGSRELKAGGVGGASLLKDKPSGTKPPGTDDKKVEARPSE